MRRFGCEAELWLCCWLLVVGWLDTVEVETKVGPRLGYMLCDNGNYGMEG